MSYASWFESHAIKHKKIVNKLVLKGYTKEQIIDYFEFENMVKEENDFCPLYKTDTKCHDMENLNCYLCACPHFRFDDNGLDTYNDTKILSTCNIKNGEKTSGGGNIHQSCSKCSVPHHKAYISKTFDLDWKKIMKDCMPNEI